METYIYIDFSKLTFTVKKVSKKAGSYRTTEKVHSLKPTRFFISAYDKLENLLKIHKNPTQIITCEL